jgi:prepilin-type N-terminal cleavage/methylation domain-containing protein
VIRRFNFFNARKTRLRAQAGFTMMELLMVVAVMLVLMAFAIPQIQGTLNWYRLNSAVAAVNWSVQSTRYQALMEGYPFQVTYNAANNTYQLASDPSSSGTFTNVGGAVPLSGDAIVVSQTNAIQFKPYGFVTPAAGSNLCFHVTYKGLTKYISVSNYGNVAITAIMPTGCS